MKATLWGKAPNEGAMTPPCIFWKHPHQRCSPPTIHIWEAARMQAGDTVALRREGQCQQNPATESCMTGLPFQEQKVSDSSWALIRA